MMVSIYKILNEYFFQYLNIVTPRIELLITFKKQFL